MPSSITGRDNPQVDNLKSIEKLRLYTKLQTRAEKSALFYKSYKLQQWTKGKQTHSVVTF